LKIENEQPIVEKTEAEIINKIDEQEVSNS
jgi:hypothetical protein